MTAFLGELGNRLADKWLSMLVLRGLFLSSVAGIAVALGHRSALDVTKLVAYAEDWTKVVSTGSPMLLVLVLIGVLLASAAAGFVVQALSEHTWRLWLGLWPDIVARPLTAHRIRRWQRAHTNGQAARRNRIALARPSRPTWMGDRIAAVENRLYHQYDVDLQSWWPRLWLTMDEAARAELQAARASFDATVNQATWSCGYALVAIFWWPASLVAIGIGLTGWAHGRKAIQAYAELIEAAVDVHAAELAQRLGAMSPGEPFTRSVGEELSARFRKGT
jgi:hypothetical protein